MTRKYFAFCAKSYNEVSEEELGEYMLGLKTMTPEEMEGLL